MKKLGGKTIRIHIVRPPGQDVDEEGSGSAQRAPPPPQGGSPATAGSRPRPGILGRPRPTPPLPHPAPSTSSAGGVSYRICVNFVDFIRGGSLRYQHLQVTSMHFFQLLCLLINFQGPAPGTSSVESQTQDVPMDVSVVSIESDDGGSKRNLQNCLACRQKVGPDRSLHRKPKKAPAQQWAAACGVTTLPESARVCSMHFRPEEIRPSGRLIALAVPTKNLPFAIPIPPQQIPEQGSGEPEQGAAEAEGGGDVSGPEDGGAGVGDGIDVSDLGEGDVGGGPEPMEEDSDASDDDEFGCALQIASELNEVCNGSAKDQEKLKALRQKVKFLQVRTFERNLRVCRKVYQVLFLLI